MATKGYSRKRHEMMNAQLGQNRVTARRRLMRRLLYDQAQRLELDLCFQCGERIDTLEEFSIEHKVPWLHSDDPAGLYFDLDNIAYSHMECNSAAARGRAKSPCGTHAKYRR